MGWLTPKYPTSDTPGVAVAASKPSRRERRAASQAQQGQRERTGELRTIAIAVANGGDTDLGAFRKVAKRMTPDATEGEIKAAHAWLSARRG